MSAVEKAIRLHWHCMCFVGPCKWQSLDDYEPDECATEFETDDTQERWDGEYCETTCPRCNAELTQKHDSPEIITMTPNATPTQPVLPTQHSCLICRRPVPDYEPIMCCNGQDCACYGQPTNPCTCSKECNQALFGGIGKSMEQRRIDAGIALFTPPPSPSTPADQNARIYKCADCGTMFSKEEGGTCFTCCGPCMDKRYPPKAKASTPAGATELRQLTKQLWDLMYLHQPFHLEKAEALIEPYILSRIAAATASAVETLTLEKDFYWAKLTEARAQLQKAEAALAAAREALGGFAGPPFDGTLVTGINAISTRCASVEADLARKEAELVEARLEAGHFAGSVAIALFGEKDNNVTNQFCLDYIKLLVAKIEQMEKRIETWDLKTVEFLQGVQNGEMTCVRAAQYIKAHYRAELAQAEKDIEWVETRISCDDHGAELLATHKELERTNADLSAERAAHERTKGELSDMTKLRESALDQWHQISDAYIASRLPPRRQ